MVTYNEYLKNILKQILSSYNKLKEVEDKDEDLNYITIEMLKINGFLKVVSNKIDIDKISLSNFDFDEIENIILDEMEKQNIKYFLKKIKKMV